MSTDLISRLNAIVATGEVSRAGLARAAGLHPNSLRKLGSAEWNPTADTLGKLEKLLLAGNTEVLVGPEAIIDEARNGRMFILVDDEDRENEGDLCLAAEGVYRSQFVTGTSNGGLTAHHGGDPTRCA